MFRVLDAARLVRAAEQSAAVLDRARPENLRAEQARVLDAWRRGERAVPEWRYAERRDDLDGLRSTLERFAAAAEICGPWGRLFAERATELSLEVALAAAIGTARVGEAARLRYPLAGDADERRAREWAELFCETPPSVSGECADRGAMSDDENDDESLLSQLRRAVGERRLPFRVEVRPGLVCRAVVGDGFIAIRPGVRLSRAATKRLVVHEVDGHALPRHRAAHDELALLCAGTAGSGADEEGRALLLEKRAGVFDDERCFELGLRHLGALAVRDGAEWPDLVDLCLGRGASLGTAIDVAARVSRGMPRRGGGMSRPHGGGLGRELTYLPALSRVESAFAQRPWMETWFEQGRVSVGAADVIEKLGPCPALLQPSQSESSTITGV